MARVFDSGGRQSNCSRTDRIRSDALGSCDGNNGRESLATSLIDYTPSEMNRVGIGRANEFRRAIVRLLLPQIRGVKAESRARKPHE